MLRQGPVSASVHGLVEYAAGALLIAAPFLFSFDSGAATALSIVVGVLLLVVAASSDHRAALQRVLPAGIHLLTDLALAGVLISAPFLFGFSDEATPTAFFLVYGVFHLLLALATRFLPERAEAPQGPRRTIGS